MNIENVKDYKVKALQAHASQTAWMMAETAKRIDEGQPMSESWLNIEKFYVVQQSDELNTPIQRVAY